MNNLTVAYQGGIKFEAMAGKHNLTIDLPPEKGGTDAGMAPPDLFVASLGSCIGVYVVRYCQNAKIDAEGCVISLDWRLSDDKKSIAAVEVKVRLPKADPGPRARAILEAARSCLIHNTLHGGLNVDITLESAR
ncbi:hypothetical protein BU251_04465 [Candidatus Velamenicoccus archaeovorus]|uniref:Osmotically inducible protein OsmC n=1 Tax=Velamenicoccus archaeovorus TaxID=1930593 RepID=A0A410P4J7_VELA1|nr:OsmC family protein [Candidatus Velamenicoccus archaeovorus]QAT17040.1 hypothetical protein BU251_04465 [Candidatus Velamenicoccus archaeovorus]